MKHVNRLGCAGVIRVGLAILLPALLAAPLDAEQVVVRNDSVEDFGDAYIVGDFIAGEEAGVRLTSPCDGTIVAIHILWLEGTPGHAQSLEQAIRIYDDNLGFPVFGTVLETLEGPVMTPGYMNVFEYIDEPQTIPLSVPVTNGQNFYVALEFYNPTDVGGGGPSVVRDDDGCQTPRNVLYGLLLWWDWYNFCALPAPFQSHSLQGDLVIRAVIDCPGVTGACCDVNATCTNGLEQSECQGPFETWYGGQTCAGVTCPTPIGACCNGMGGCLDGLEQADCENNYNGIYPGNGTTCADDVCVLGACCLPDGACQDVVEVVCLGDGGTFEGAGTACATTSCPQPSGACCVGENCSIQTQTNCTGFGGEWAGPATVCPGTPTDLCPICDDGDVAGDGDVDLADFATFQMCFSASYTASCKCVDMDNDLDVDVGDYVLFESALQSSGP